jgi:gas vesicle protein
MTKNEQEVHDDTNIPGYFIAGIMLGSLLGGLIGAAIMLFTAPQSGAKTRKQMRRKARDLRLKTSDAVDDAVTQVRDKAHDVTTGIQDQAESLQQRGVDMVDNQKERWSPVVEAGKKAVNG